MFKKCCFFGENLGFFGKILDYREKSWVFGKNPGFFGKMEWTGSSVDQVVDKWPTPKSQGLESRESPRLFRSPVTLFMPI